MGIETPRKFLCMFPDSKSTVFWKFWLVNLQLGLPSEKITWKSQLEVLLLRIFLKWIAFFSYMKQD